MTTPQFYSDILAFVDDLRIRSMFGGHGVYSSTHMFGLIDDGELFFKVDDTTRPDYQSLDSAPFSYPAKDKTGAATRTVMTGYWRVPDAILDDPEALSAWTLRAITVARQKSTKKRSSSKSEQPSGFNGLGKVSRAWLAEIGIHNLGDLKSHGAIASFAALKAKFPRRVSFNLLWGLYALINDVALKTVDEETKSHLKSLLRHQDHSGSGAGTK